MNWIPKIEYTELFTLINKTITFGSPPEGDPFNEDTKGSFKEVVSSSGNYQRQWNYNEQIYNLKFKFQTKAVADLMDTFIEAHANKGGAFNYFPSSDEVEYETYRLQGTSFKKERPIFNGADDFEYHFDFKVIRTKEAPVMSDLGTGAIGETQALIANNQVSPAEIVGLVFDELIVGSAFITYDVVRTTTGGSGVEVKETGSIKAQSAPTAGTWDFDASHLGTANITFSVDNDGQFFYTSENQAGDAYAGYIRFRASTIGVVE